MRRRWAIEFLLCFAVCTAMAATVMLTDGLPRSGWRATILIPVARFSRLALLPGRLIAATVAVTDTSDLAWFHWVVTVAITAAGLWATWRLICWMWRRRTPPRESEGSPDEPSDGITRRDLLHRGVAGAAVISMASVSGWATVIAPERLRIARLTVPIEDLPPDLDGMRLCHITDTHHGPYVALPTIQRAIDTANALEPDLTLLTGDYVHRTPEAIPEGIGILAGLRARLGCLAVLGNHDHWEGVEACREAFATTGIPLIDNDRRYLTAEGLHAEPRPDALCIAGVGDLWENDADPERALGPVAPETPRLLLSHNPDLAEEIDPALRVDLMLSGHTHGGQVRVPFLGTPVVPSKFGQKYAGGLVQGPTCRVLVSRGVGMAVLPVRWGVPPEIGLVTLVRG